MSVWVGGDFCGHFLSGDGRFDGHALSCGFRLVWSFVVLLF